MRLYIADGPIERLSPLEILIVILVTFGFTCVEYVSMSLDDPFGDDTNDVDEHGMGLLVYEDIYLAIYQTDGSDAAVSLRNRILDLYRQGRELDCYRDDLKGRWSSYTMHPWRPHYSNSYIAIAIIPALSCV